MEGSSKIGNLCFSASSVFIGSSSKHSVCKVSIKNKCIKISSTDKNNMKWTVFEMELDEIKSLGHLTLQSSFYYVIELSDNKAALFEDKTIKKIDVEKFRKYTDFTGISLVLHVKTIPDRVTQLVERITKQILKFNYQLVCKAIQLQDLLVIQRNAILSGTANFETSFTRLRVVKIPNNAYVISVHELVLLKTEGWFNDILINHYMMSMFETMIPDNVKKYVHVFSSYFFSKLYSCESQMENVLHRWAKNMNIFEKKVVIIPINLEYHWSSIVLYGGTSVKPSRENKIHVFLLDSLALPSLSDPRYKTIIKFLEIHYKLKYDEKINGNQISKLNPELKHQSNGSDCGLFIIEYVENFIKFVLDEENEITNNFANSDMNRKRAEIFDHIMLRALKNRTLPTTDKNREID